jgi:cytochrome b subunit of formate dehydrogenase
MAFHFLFMWFFTLNGILYILYTGISGQWRELAPKKNSFKEAWLVLLHDLHIRKTAPPQNKYNAAQRIAYTAIIIMGLGSVITGLAIYKPAQFYYFTWLCGGYHFARILHFALTLGYVFFFLVHVFQVIMAGWNNFRSVISGFEVVNTEPVPALQFVGPPAESAAPPQTVTINEKPVPDVQFEAKEGPKPAIQPVKDDEKHEDENAG